MKKILAAAALAGLSTTPIVSGALAADMAVKAPMYAKAPLVMPYSWTGFYLGANVGGSVGRSRTDVVGQNGSGIQDTTYLSAAGAIGGVQAGYNWQTNLPLLGATVFGVEADIQGSGQNTSDCIGYCFTNNTNGFALQQKINSFGTVRGRVGLVTGPVLSYVTGGYAYGNVTTSGVEYGTASNVPFSLSQTRGGWTLGSGVEASLGGNWTGKIEYLYLDLGTQTQVQATGVPVFGSPTIESSHIRDNIFRAGVNYAFNGNPNYKAPVANWSGLYLGLNAGSLTARNQSNYNSVGTANLEVFSLVPDGYEGGAQIGYNWQAGSWVFGAEADFQGASSRDNRTCVYTCTSALGAIQENQKTPYFGTVRGRLGYSVGSTLFYGTAGFAYGETKTNQITTFTGGGGVQNVSLTHNKSGYAVGGGVESPLQLFGLFGPAWTVKTEYLFVDLGHTTDVYANTSFGGTDTFNIRTQEHIFRTGINYHFNTPVVARY